MLASSNKSGWMHCKRTYIDDQMLATKQVCSTIALIGILRPLAARFFDTFAQSRVRAAETL